MKEKAKIEDLERQIAELQEQLRLEKQRKESLWNDLYETFLDKVYGSEANEDSEMSCKVLASLVSVKLTEWANKQREALAEKIARSGSLRMPVYTDCLNDLVFTLAQPGTTPPPVVKPSEVPQSEFDSMASEEGEPALPPVPGPRENFAQPGQDMAPMEKLNSFSKRVNVPKPSRRPTKQP